MILLVEDNEDDVFILERAMAKSRIKAPLHIVEDGREALNYLQGLGKYADRNAHPLPALIFLDLKLPFVHGFEVLEWISQHPTIAQIPVVILSSSPEERDRERAAKLGAKKFLVKPPTPEMVEQAAQLFLPQALQSS